MSNEERLKKKVSNLQVLVKTLAKKAGWPHCPGCGHDDDEGHKADCLLRSEYSKDEPSY